MNTTIPRFFISALTALVLSTGALAQSPAQADVKSRTFEQDGKTIQEHTVTTTATVRQVQTKPAQYQVAIVVTNRAGQSGDAQLGALEDFITSRVTDLGLRVISAETTLNAVSALAPGAKATDLDAQFADSTSAVRLSQTMGADYVLQVSISGLEANQRTVDAYGVKAVNEERIARVTYKILDGTTGASLAADTVRTNMLVQQSAASSNERSDAYNGLLDEAAGKVATSLKRAIDRGRLGTPNAAAALVNVELSTEVADLYIPDVRIGAENTLTISQSKFKVAALSATVEIDGIAMGTAPGTIQVKAGLSKLRVVREGFKPWERTVNFANGQKLNVTLEMSDAGYARWKDATAFINNLKNGAKLTDAEVKVLEGEAKALENSGFKVNVNTKEGITINERSLFGR
ncbi:MAG: PEGA domain-containing protein [Candidatus Didemnitutus sp.]|nr:PEGA domain-containing protein [Candidatus Didemnitutus sp.]